MKFKCPHCGKKVEAQPLREPRLRTPRSKPTYNFGHNILLQPNTPRILWGLRFIAENGKPTFARLAIQPELLEEDEQMRFYLERGYIEQVGQEGFTVTPVGWAEINKWRALR